MAHQYHSLSTLFLCALLFIHNPTSVAVARGQDIRVGSSNPQPGRNITSISASCGKIEFYNSGKNKNFQPAVELYGQISLHRLATVVFAWSASACACACGDIVPIHAHHIRNTDRIAASAISVGTMQTATAWCICLEIWSVLCRLQMNESRRVMKSRTDTHHAHLTVFSGWG